jgi:hypothetical protein
MGNPRHGGMSMTRSEESGGFQGAISSMLSLADICPSCGKLIAEHRRKFPFAASGRCPDTVLGAFPFIAEGAALGSKDDGSSFSPPPAPTRRYPTAPHETAAGVFATPAPGGRASRRQELLTMVWNLAHNTEELP